MVHLSVKHPKNKKKEKYYKRIQLQNNSYKRKPNKALPGTAIGFSSFFLLRYFIAKLMNEELGKAYFTLPMLMWSSKEEQRIYNDEIDRIIKAANLDEDIVNFLYMPDCDGIINYKVVEKIHALLSPSKEELVIECSRINVDEFFELLEYSISKKMDLFWH